MNLYDLFQELEKNADSEKAKQMSKYMRNQFLFLGIQATIRKKTSDFYFKEAKKEKYVDWEFIATCWKKPYREAQYMAIDYLNRMKDYLVLEDIEKIKKLITNKSWWDTVDGLHRVIGHVAFKYPEIDKTMIQWSLDENIWLRRMAINHQMFRKEKMKEELLEEIIVNNFGQDEFFINKAIGWTLRDYSKVNPEWVREFIDRYREKLSKLSISEGSKYI
ncbi:DNA alkylation repair protein [Carnobacterium funditum]|uniref:DNA alkylation repair protein n=1 Tax=Carnobacterium funditum TaxID=2752 RepID=UPI00054E9BF5|nr:DNA alkylation repair protein [Carnobacterium funditum]